jgi:transmembrane sensor
MSADRIWKLIARKLSHEASQEELHELDLLLREHPDLHFPIQTITDLWSQSSQDVDGTNLEQSYQEHIHHMLTKGISLPNHTDEHSDNTYLLTGSRIKNRRRWLVWSAVLIPILSGASWLLFKTTNNTRKETAKVIAPISEVSTKNGSKSQIVLPDGTKVRLNAGSKLTYDDQYGNGIREVNLTGEAYFDVVKNAEKPFVIHTSKIDIKVLGTEFNVKSYPGDKTTEASLVRGRIEVRIRNRPSEPIILHPNEKIVVLNESDSIKRNVVTRNEKVKKDPLLEISNLTYVPKYDALVETSWIENKLIFRDESFKELATKMERWYGVHINFRDRSVEELRFTGIFESESIRTALKALTITEHFNYNIDGDQIMISK